MPEVENFYESAQHCFEVAKSSGFLESNDFLENVALEAFDLLVANHSDPIFAHALGVKL